MSPGHNMTENTESNSTKVANLANTDTSSAAMAPVSPALVQDSSHRQASSGSTTMSSQITPKETIAADQQESPLLALPREIRDRILGFVMDSYPLGCCTCKPPLALRIVNRQIHDETIDAYRRLRSVLMKSNDKAHMFNEIPVHCSCWAKLNSARKARVKEIYIVGETQCSVSHAMQCAAERDRTLKVAAGTCFFPAWKGEYSAEKGPNMQQVKVKGEVMYQRNVHFSVNDKGERRAYQGKEWWK